MKTEESVPSEALARIIAPKTFEEAMAVAGKLAKSDLVPKAYKDKPENIVIAWELGAEVGLSPMTSLQSIAVIGGRPSLYGEAPLAVVMRSGLLEEITEENDGEVATCTVKRRNFPQKITRTFSMEEARKAKVFERTEKNPNGSWVPLADRWAYQYWGKDMLGYRARGRALKALFADVLKGLAIGEEVRDTQGTMNGEVIETVEVKANEFMPKQMAEKPVQEAPAPAKRPRKVRNGAQAKGPESPQAETSQAPHEEGSGSPEVSAPEPETAQPTAQASRPPDTAPGGSGEVPTPAVGSPVLFEIAGARYQTKGMTRAQMLTSFQLVPQVTRKKGKGTAEALIKSMFGVTSRIELTEAQAAEYLERLGKELE